MKPFWAVFFFICTVAFLAMEAFARESTYNVMGWMISAAATGFYVGRWHVDRMEQREAGADDDDS